MSSEDRQPATLHEMLMAVKKLRDEVPVFDPNVDGNKEKIEYFHQALHTVVLSIQQEVGFDSYERTLKFIDTELAMSA
jgi:hypothetical protein